MYTRESRLTGRLPAGRAEDASFRMTTITFDTLQFVRRLKAAGVPEAQAEAFAEAFMEAQSQADLATKRDLMELEMRLRTDLASVKSEIIKWVAGMLLLQAGLVAALVKLL